MNLVSCIGIVPQSIMGVLFVEEPLSFSGVHSENEKRSVSEKDVS